MNGIDNTPLAPTSLSANDYFDAVLDAARESAATSILHDRRLAGLPVRFSFACAQLEAKLFPALQHLSPWDAATNPFTIFCWSSSESWLLDQSRWPLQEYWQRDELLSIRTSRGHLACDPQSGILSLYDRESRVASLWTPSPDDVSFWVNSQPLMKILNWWLAEEEMIFCHAAAIGTPDAAVLVVGPSGSGKSTTAVASLSSRLQFLGEDYVAVSHQGPPKVYTIYNSAKLESAQLRRHFPELTPAIRLRADSIGYDKDLLFISETHPQKLLQEAPLKAIFVPEIANLTTPIIEPISSAEAFKALAPSTIFQLPGNTREKFTMLSQLVRKLPVYRLGLSTDLDSNTDLIESFLEA